MIIEINETTKWYDFKARVPDNQLNKFIEQIQKEHTICHPFDFNQITIGQFAELLDYKLPRVLYRILSDVERVTVFQVVEIRNSCDKFMDYFDKIHRAYTVPQTQAEQIASANLLKPSIIENMLMFTLKYFGLHNFGDAEKITILEYVLAKKHTFISETFNRRHNAELIRQSKVRNRRR